MVDQSESGKKDGLTCEVVQNGQIIIFTLTDMHNATVDAWVEHCLNMMKQCVEDKRPLLVLQDLSCPGVGQTTYSLIRGQDVTHAYPELKGRVAFVLSETFVAQRTRRFVEAQPTEARERQIFSNRAAALAWLMEGISKQDSENSKPEIMDKPK